MPQTNKIIDHQEPVSDHYSLAAVKSYEVFDAGMDGYVFMLVRLKTGEHFPMLCRKTSRGIYPIPQTVFAETGKEHWSIMCEPHVRNQSALMLLKMSRVADNLFKTDKKLKATAKVPLLSTPQ